ncbi:MAG TPA: addiction module antidote protein [Sphingomonas sp.]|jgi:probable addiction module antidote protein
MTTTLTRFDPMEHLDTNADHIDLLNDALATRNPRVVINAVAEIARDRGMTKLAQQAGIGRSSLYNALADDGNPTIETIMKVLDALQIELRATGIERVSKAAAG